MDLHNLFFLTTSTEQQQHFMHLLSTSLSCSSGIHSCNTVPWTSIVQLGSSTGVVVGLKVTSETTDQVVRLNCRLIEKFRHKTWTTINIEWQVLEPQSKENVFCLWLSFSPFNVNLNFYLNSYVLCYLFCVCVTVQHFG